MHRPDSKPAHLRYNLYPSRALTIARLHRASHRRQPVVRGYPVTAVIGLDRTRNRTRQNLDRTRTGETS